MSANKKEYWKAIKDQIVKKLHPYFAHTSVVNENDQTVIKWEQSAKNKWPGSCLCKQEFKFNFDGGEKGKVIQFLQALKEHTEAFKLSVGSYTHLMISKCSVIVKTHFIKVDHSKPVEYIECLLKAYWTQKNQVKAYNRLKKAYMGHQQSPIKFAAYVQTRGELCNATKAEIKKAFRQRLKRSFVKAIDKMVEDAPNRVFSFSEKISAT